MMNVIISKLPMKNNSQTDWKAIEKTYIDVIYKDIKYTVFINKYDIKSRYLFINYNDTYDFKINPSSFKKCALGKLLGFINTTHNYAIGDIVKIKGGSIEILKQIKTMDANGWSLKAYEYLCLKCNGISVITESSLTSKCGCNICANRKVIKEINSIWKTHFSLVKYFKNIEDSYKYTYGNRNKIWLKCPNCGQEYERVINSFIKKGFVCPNCGDGISYPNKFAFNLLNQSNINFTPEYSPNWIKPKRYDFYFKLNNKEYILEMDGGIGHGKGNYKNNMTAEESQEIDDYKDKLAKEHDVEVIRIDCDYCHNDRFQYIKNNILKNETINELFDLNSIDWIKIEEFCLSSRIKEACTLWNSGISSTIQIGIIMNLSSVTISRYLKKGRNVKWCEYDENKQREKGLLSGRNRGLPVICINNKNTFPSAKNAYETVGISRTGITNCCRGKNNFAGRDRTSRETLFWMYLDDYEIYNNENSEINIFMWNNIHLYLYDKYNTSSIN